ncbi:DNA gyrase subunit A [Candidatus Berkelbacteria bacterium RIFCSPLOWO2_01_FULL_50_28]|uniref:DNA gyrase subunit A n=1 Tax=Candidatus Berkelbacteria bacterium RIFCSPLOWO2_01_FULL_50_28 TaxID=1797471 RepID=A0A1F5EBZ8_9BACT|nr:MAG: DNA gyrase subunit A [Candidatus Berkelbacteria bacterium RIFCSPHIGHO2_01_FULL_50_36]OGD64939.1 MAG: DNA gyrase subunit A [Candidatus Berkelbacteria bacterium RIFCSPLOWO2_01_FULL_50_28]
MADEKIIQPDPESLPEKTNFGVIKPRSIHQEMSESYLDYAMSVIVARALPDIRDGLKPVQRRILYVMREMGLSAGAKHQKSAKIVGQVMGLFHPHGDSAIYDAMARMAQWWSLRLPLINGQGNFGSMDGDPPAAMRYTEARMAAAAETMLLDIDKETVDWQENYDGTQSEPMVLPTRLPNLLVNGSQGIAVGMATNIPPHNLNEIIDALVVLLEKPDAELDELLDIVKGPDFPTGAIAYNAAEMREALSTGRGRVVVRGRAEIEEEKNRSRIIVSELPYQTNKANFITHIADLVKSKRLEGLSDIRDESDREHGVRVVIELKLGAIASKILNQLYELTELQTVVHYNMVALIDGLQPKLLNVSEILSEFLAHRVTVITRRTEFELKIAKARAHILEGLKIALDHLDAIIALIRNSADRDAAKKGLMETYKLSELQANAILDMRLSQLANLERQKIYDEYEEVLKLIADLEDILSKPARVQTIIKQELAEIKEKFGEERRTEIRPEALGQLTALDLIPIEPVIITLTSGNYVKRLASSAYKSQGRGGKGVIGMTTRDDDAVEQIVFGSTHDDIFFFTNLGRVFTCKAYEIPASSRQSKGVALPNLIRVLPDEKVTTIINISASQDKQEGSFFFFATQNGAVKRVKVEMFKNVRKSGVVAMGLKKGDQLKWVKLTSGSDEIAQITRNAQVIVYNESEARPMGRSAGGVRGIRLKGNDKVIETEVIAETSEAICVISQNGVGKKVSMKEFRNQRRGGSGIRIAKLNTKTGELASSVVLDSEATDIVIATTGGQIIRISASSVKKLSRHASGVILIRPDKGDTVSSLAVLNNAVQEVIEDDEQDSK